MPEPASSAPRLIAKVLRELARAEMFGAYADVKPALRARLARLGIRATPAEIDDAINWVGDAALVREPRLSRREARSREMPSETAGTVGGSTLPPITREQAADLLDQIRRRLTGAEMP